MKKKNEKIYGEKINMGWAARKKKDNRQKLEMTVYGHEDDKFQDMLGIFYHKGLETVKENGWYYILQIRSPKDEIILGLYEVSLSSNHRISCDITWLFQVKDKRNNFFELMNSSEFLESTTMLEVNDKKNNFFELVVKPQLQTIREKISSRAKKDYDLA